MTSIFNGHDATATEVATQVQVWQQTMATLKGRCLQVIQMMIRLSGLQNNEFISIK